MGKLRRRRSRIVALTPHWGLAHKAGSRTGAAPIDSGLRSQVAGPRSQVLGFDVLPKT